MAIATTRTLLPLDRFAAIAGIHPCHFNQVTIADLAPATVCDMPVVKYSWQNADAVGREEIAQAIADAEAILELHAGFSPAPRWVADERVPGIRPLWPELFNGNARNVRGMATSLRTKLGYVISGGIEGKTLIQSADAIVYTDPNGDGYFETATIITPTTVLEPEEIAIYYPGKSGQDAYEIRPIQVTIAGSNATIVCRREQLVLESLQESFDARAVDGLDNANFLTTVDVYRHYNNPEQQVQFMWEGCACNGEGCAACSHATQYGCLLARDYKLGIVVPHPATWDPTSNAFDTSCYSVSRAPEQARLWYYAGYRDMRSSTPNISMSSEWERAVTYLALSLLDRPLCACKPLEAFVSYWKEDLSYNQASTAVSTSFTLSRRRLDNPIGTTRGALNAWRLIQRTRIFDSA